MNATSNHSRTLAAKLCLWGIVLGAISLAPQAGAASVVINLQVQGPGAATYGSPAPWLEGQNLTLSAQPRAGAIFVGWADGVTTTNRTILVSRTNRTDFTAVFTAIPFDPTPFFDGWGLDPIDPAYPPFLEQPQVAGGRIGIPVNLPGRNGFRLLGSSALGQGPFVPVPFALSSNSPAMSTENFADPGPIVLWVEPPTNQTRGFYQLELDNGLTVPALYFADVSWVAPNADLTLHGANLAGTVTAHVGAVPLPASPRDATSVRVTAPGTPGVWGVGVTVNGIQAVGTVGIMVVPATNAATLNAVSNYVMMPGGVLRLTGTGFGPDTEVWLDQQLLQILARSADGTELFVRLPLTKGAGRLSVVAGGVRSAGIDVNITGMSYTAAVRPVQIYAQGPMGINSTPAVQPVNIYAPGPMEINNTPAVAPVNVYAPGPMGINSTPGVVPVNVYAPGPMGICSTPAAQPVNVYAPGPMGINSTPAVLPVNVYAPGLMGIYSTPAVLPVFVQAP